MAVAGTGAIIGAISVKMAADFEAATTRLQTQAHMSVQSVDEVRKGLLKMATEVGTSPTELSNGFYHVASALTQLPPQLRNVNSELDIYKNAVELSKIGNADLEQSTQAVIGVLAAYSKEGFTAAQAAAELNAIVGAGDMKMQQLTAAMATGILPAAATFGLKLKDVGAALATLTDNVTPADEAATRLRMTFSLLAAPSHQAQKAMGAIGLNATDLARDMRQPNGLLVALTDLRGHLSHIDVSNFAGGIEQAKKDLTGFGLQTSEVDHAISKLGPDGVEQALILSKAFGGGRTSAAIMTLLTEFDSFKEKYTAIDEGAKKFNEDWAATQKTFANQLDRLKASAEVFSITLGTRLLPILTPIVKWLADAAGSTNGWVQALVNFASGAGLILLALSALAAVLPFIGAGFTLMMGPVGIAIALLVGGALLIQRNWSNLASFFEGIVGRISTALGRLSGGGSGAQAIFQALTGIGPSARAGVQESGRMLGMQNRPSGGAYEPFQQESAAALRGNRGASAIPLGPEGAGVPTATQRAPGTAGGPGYAGVPLGAARTALGGPSSMFGGPTASQRAIGAGGGGVASGLLRGAQGTQGAAGAPGVSEAPTQAATLANTLGPAIDHAIDLFKKLRHAWDEVTSGFKNGASPLTILIGVLMDLGMSGDRVVAIAHFLQAAWDLLSKAWQALASYVGPLLRQLFNEAILPAMREIQKQAGPLGESMHRAFVAAEPVLKALAIILGVVGAIIVGILAGALRGLVAMLGVVLPDTIHLLITIFKIAFDAIALIFDVFVGIIRIGIAIFRAIFMGEWRQLWDTVKDVFGTWARDVKNLFGDLWDAIGTIFHLVIVGILAFVKGFVEGIIGWFQWLFNQLIGHSIIPDLVNGIIHWFQQIPTVINGLIDNFVKGAVDKFGNLRDGVINAAKDIARGLIDHLGGGINAALGLFRNFLSVLGKIPGVGEILKDAATVLKDLDLGGMKKAVGLATGGMITNGPHYIVGEGNSAFPEWVLPSDPAHRGRAMELLGSFVKAIGLASGGVMGGYRNPYPEGECTFYVASRFPGLPIDGNAGNWGSLPLQHVSSPAPGEIVVYRPGSHYSGFGHVAVVESTMMGNNQFQVSEMNYVGHGVTSSRMSDMTDVVTFLVPGVPGVGSPATGTSGGGFSTSGPLVDAALKAAQGMLGGIPDWLRGFVGSLLPKVAEGVKSRLLSFVGGTPSGGPLTGSHADMLHAAEKIAGVGSDWDQGLDIIIQHESGWSPTAENRTDSNARAGNSSVGLMQLTRTNRAQYDPDESAVGQIVGGIRYILARYGGIGNVPGVRSVLSGGAYRPYDSGGLLPPGLTLAYNGTGRNETVLPPGGLGGDLGAKLDRANELLYAILTDAPPVSGFTANLRAG